MGKNSRKIHQFIPIIFLLICLIVAFYFPITIDEKIRYDNYILYINGNFDITRTKWGVLNYLTYTISFQPNPIHINRIVLLALFSVFHYNFIKKITFDELLFAPYAAITICLSSPLLWGLLGLSLYNRNKLFSLLVIIYGNALLIPVYFFFIFFEKKYNELFIFAIVCIALISINNNLYGSYFLNMNGFENLFNGNNDQSYSYYGVSDLNLYLTKHNLSSAYGYKEAFLHYLSNDTSSFIVGILIKFALFFIPFDIYKDPNLIKFTSYIIFLYILFVEICIFYYYYRKNKLDYRLYGLIMYAFSLAFFTIKIRYRSLYYTFLLIKSK